MELRERLQRRGPEPTPEHVDDGRLTVVLTAFDAARADSAVIPEA